MNRELALIWTRSASGDPRLLEPGQLLVFFTDGFQEAEAPDRRRCGIKSVLQIIHANRGKPAAEIVNALIQAVEQFCQPGTPQDDVTLVVIKVEG